MKKIIKRICSIIFLVTISYTSFLVFKGYQLYQTALQETSLESKFTAIQNSSNFTPINELPELYKRFLY